MCARAAVALLLLPLLACRGPKAHAEAVEEMAAPDAAVLVMTEHSKDIIMKEHHRLLVEFYAPWCGHCKKLEPEYAKAAETLQAQGLKTRLAKVDATVEKELAAEYEISGFPTLWYVVNGTKSVWYRGEPKETAIVNWLRARELPPVREMKAAEAEQFMASAADGDFVIFGRVKPKSARSKVLKEAAAQLVEGLGSTFRLEFVSAPLPKGSDPKKDATITIRRAGFDGVDAETIDFTGKWTDSSITKWVKESMYRTLGKQYDMRYYSEAIAELGWDGVVVVSHDDESAIDEEEKKAGKVREVMMPLVSKYPKWKFTLSEWSTMDEGDKDSVGLQGEPVLTLSVLENKKKYVLKGDEFVLDSGKVETWLADVKAKNVKPFYRSDKPPENEVDEDGVTVVTGDSFERLVLNKDHDVFVMFYAPWCGHCQQLKPVWSELGRHAKSSSWRQNGIIVAKVDGTTNECEEEMEGYPKLVLYPSGQKKIKQKKVYSGRRELEPMIEFLEENSPNLERIAESGKGLKKQSLVERELEKQRRKKGNKEDL